MPGKEGNRRFKKRFGSIKQRWYFTRNRETREREGLRKQQEKDKGQRMANGVVGTPRKQEVHRMCEAEVTEILKTGDVGEGEKGYSEGVLGERMLTK